MSLQDILKSLPIKDKSLLYSQLGLLNKDTLKFYKQWEELDVAKSVIENIIKICQKYDASSLQLNGLSIWLLEMLCISSITKNITIEIISQKSTMEMLLRIGLEHNRPCNTCFSLLNMCISNNKFEENREKLEILCDISK
jgi:hypothetical protein